METKQKTNSRPGRRPKYSSSKQLQKGRINLMRRKTPFQHQVGDTEDVSTAWKSTVGCVWKKTLGQYIRNKNMCRLCLGCFHFYRKTTKVNPGEELLTVGSKEMIYVREANTAEGLCYFMVKHCMKLGYKNPDRPLLEASLFERDRLHKKGQACLSQSG